MTGQSAASGPAQPDLRRVVVAVEGTSADAAALRTAIREAGSRPAPVHLVRSFPASTGRAGSTRAVAAQKAEQLAAARHLERLRAVVAAALPGLPVTAALTTAHLARALVAASRTADVVVLRAAAAGAPTDAVAQEVARHAWCPVLLDRSANSAPELERPGVGDVRPPVADDVGRVVVGVGDAASARELLTAAVEEAARRGTGLLVVHARSPLAPARAAPRPHGPAADPELRAPVAQHDATEEQLADAVDRLRRDRPGVPVELRQVDGAPGGVLVDLSRGADLLVVGRPHRTGLLPRATTVAVDRATSAVLVVPVIRPEPGPPGAVVIPESRPEPRLPRPTPAPGASV
jgi:nucleotide-binding universal stress UspA family protein